MVLRHLESREDFAACVELQRRVWGAGFEDLTPPALLKIVGRVGGVAAGAFSSDGRLEGFVFGVSGIAEGCPVHWSHMLAVRPGRRGRGLGVALKAFQRRTLLDLGVETMFWTYDPLVSRNAHVNLNRLGVRIDRYIRDFYGVGDDSRLSAGIGTDRFVVRWEMAGARAARALAGGSVEATHPEGWASVPVVNVRDGEPVEADLSAEGEPRPARLRVEVPVDIQAVRDDAPARAVAWRVSSRRAFEQALELGYSIDRLLRSPDGRRAFYLLEREGA